MKQKMGAVLGAVAVTGFLFGQVATSGVASAQEEGMKPHLLPEGVYLVKDHDTLWALAGRFLDNPRLWPTIWKQNPFIPNPDLIFPGDPLIIPGLTGPPKTVAEAPPVPEEWVTPPPAPGPEVGLPWEEELMPAEEAPWVAVTERPEEAIGVPERGMIPIISPGQLACTGYVAERSEIHTVGSIAGSADRFERRFASLHEVFVDLRGRPVRQGDRFQIIRPTRPVAHPVTGRRMGVKVRMLGTVEIIDLTGPKPRARIVYSCEDIVAGDALAEIDAVDVPPVGLSRPTQIQRAGFIVASKSDADALSQGDIVYVDVGQEEQIVPGDEFAIYKRTGRETAIAQLNRGDLVVVRTTARSAAALVTRSDLVLSEGERIILLRKMP